MGQTNYIYLLGIIKWVNVMTLGILSYKFLMSLDLGPEVSIFIGIILMLLINIKVNNWFISKFGRDNLIEGTLFFKILNYSLMGLMVIALIIKQQYTILIIFGVTMGLVTLGFKFAGKVKK